MKAREKHGLSQKEISERLNIAQPSYWAYEAGKAKPKPPTAKKIASVLGVDWTRFYDDSAEMKEFIEPCRGL